MPTHFATLADFQKQLKVTEPKLGESYELTRMVAAVEALEHPERQYRVVHVAGTSGKGSTCVLTASILRAAGYSVGLYTSPAFVTPLNGIIVNGKAITEKQALRILNKLSPIIQAHKLTHFEALALLAFKWFAEQHVDFSVIEVGVGGRLDATNVVQPTVAVVTTVGLDHTELLGSTLPEIAAEKAAIIKPGSIGLTGYAKLGKGKFIDVAKAKILETSLEGTLFSYKTHKQLQLKLLGQYQVQNAVLAIEVAEQLHVSSQAIRLGLLQAKQPGRFQIIKRHPLIIADGAHNPQKMQALVQSLKAMGYKKHLVGLVSIKETKDIVNTFKPLLPLLDTIVLTTFPNSYKLLDLKQTVKRLNPKLKIVAVPNSSQAYRAFRKQLQPNDVGIITGSLYLIGKLQSVL